MKLPTEKLEEVEYYEEHIEQGHNVRGLPYAKDIIILHYGEWEKEYKLFGKWTVWTKTMPDRSERFEFERNRTPKDDDRYKLGQTDAFVSFRNQLRAYFDNEFSEVYDALQRHEIDYMT